MKGNLIYLLSIMLVSLGLVILLLCIFVIPYMGNTTAENFPEFAYLKLPVMVYVYATALPFYVGIFYALKICREIVAGREFTRDNVRSLTRVSQMAATEIVLYVVGVIALITQNAMHFGIILLVLTVVFMSAAIAVFAALLAHLVQQAVLVKEENEYTI